MRDGDYPARRSAFAEAADGAFRRLSGLHVRTSRSTPCRRRRRGSWTRPATLPRLSLLRRAARRRAGRSDRGRRQRLFDRHRSARPRVCRFAAATPRRIDANIAASGVDFYVCAACPAPFPSSSRDRALGTPPTASTTEDESDPQAMTTPLAAIPPPARCLARHSPIAWSTQPARRLRHRAAQIAGRGHTRTPVVRTPRSWRCAEPHTRRRLPARRSRHARSVSRTTAAPRRTDALFASGVARVFIVMRDPNRSFGSRLGATRCRRHRVDGARAAPKRTRSMSARSRMARPPWRALRRRSRRRRSALADAPANGSRHCVRSDGPAGAACGAVRRRRTVREDEPRLECAGRERAPSAARVVDSRLETPPERGSCAARRRLSTPRSKTPRAAPRSRSAAPRSCCCRRQQAKSTCAMAPISSGARSRAPRRGGQKLTASCAPLSRRRLLSPSRRASGSAAGSPRSALAPSTTRSASRSSRSSSSATISVSAAAEHAPATPAPT